MAIDGPAKAVELLRKEAGGHRWQRVPPTEKSGRVHSSTVTVVVLEAVDEMRWVLDDRDLVMRFQRDTGPGGQHRNKTESCVVLTHVPTGLQAKSADRCQHANRRQARAVLEARVREHFQKLALTERSFERKTQAGSGQRGDKVRTYSAQHGLVTDHRTGRKASLKKILAGDLALLA